MNQSRALRECSRELCPSLFIERQKPLLDDGKDPLRVSREYRTYKCHDHASTRNILFAMYFPCIGFLVLIDIARPLRAYNNPYTRNRVDDCAVGNQFLPIWGECHEEARSASGFAEVKFAVASERLGNFTLECLVRCPCKQLFRLDAIARH